MGADRRVPGEGHERRRANAPGRVTAGRGGLTGSTSRFPLGTGGAPAAQPERVGSGRTLTIIFPKFRPSRTPISAAGAASSP